MVGNDGTPGGTSAPGSPVSFAGTPGIIGLDPAEPSTGVLVVGSGFRLKEFRGLPFPLCLWCQVRLGVVKPSELSEAGRTWLGVPFPSGSSVS